VKFLVDNQLPMALSRFLEAQGIVSQHVMDVHLDEATAQEIWHYAKEQNYTLVSKDEDFFHLATLDSEGPAVIWVRLGNCRKATLLEVFGQLLPQLLEVLASGQKIVEIQ
jgi:predicted nuclease of predicted toxin-antitoxin system